MPATEFRAGAHLPDDQLAACLCVPAEKIADRRAELAAEQDQARPGQLCAKLLDPGPAATRRTALQRTPAPPAQTTRRTTLNDRSATTPTQHPVCAIESRRQTSGPDAGASDDRTRCKHGGCTMLDLRE